MRIQTGWSSLVVLAICLLACRANAAPLTGKVIEVNDGDEITIFNLNRPVRIRLIGIDAPEKDQAFGDIAKQHLTDLVYGKFVFVETSGIGQHTSLVGRVLLNDTDISAQMLRDGAAWFDKRWTLSEPQREMYSQSELAARNEKRGLWQTDGAVPPWEFVKAEELKTTSVAVATKGGPTQLVRPDNPTPELNSMSLLQTGGGIAKPLSVLSEDYAAFDDSQKPWYQFKPEGEDFSAFVPKGGAQKLKPLTLLDRTVEINYYVVRDRDSVYELLWAVGPNQDKTDTDAIKAGLSGIYKEMNKAFQRANVGTFECEPLAERNISSGGYAGREFDLTSCPLRGMARIYTKVIGDQRQLYLGFVFANEIDDKVSKFINSFKVSVKKSPDTKPAINTKGAVSESDQRLIRAFDQHQSDLQVEGTGTVSRLLSDDNDGGRHQRFIVQLKTGQTLLIARNIDLAPRINSLEVGDEVGFFGEYEWNEKGGTIHWTHRDPNRHHTAGWIKHEGRVYQ